MGRLILPLLAVAIIKLSCIAVEKPNPADAAQLKVGVAKVSITPVVDKKGLPVWLAGFSTGRRATGIHDPIFARAMFLEREGIRIVIVSLDVVGFFHPDVIACRELLAKTRSDLRNVHVLVCSTHNHEGPDTMGLWGPAPLVSGVDPDYMKQVREKIVTVIAAASDRAVHACLRFAEARTTGLIADSRLPRVIHDTIHIMHAQRAVDDRTIGSLLLWHSHPESLGSRNTEITADFPKYVIDEMEASLGGTTVYLSGTVGGLLGPLGVRVKDEKTGQIIPSGSFAHAEQIGRRAARTALHALDGVHSLQIKRLAVKTRMIDLPLANPLFRLGAALGLTSRPFFTNGQSDARSEYVGERLKRDEELRFWLEKLREETGRLAGVIQTLRLPAGEDIRTELNAITIGPLQLITIPGELYPELAIGGIQQPQDSNSDFPKAPLEPPLFGTMRGRHKWVVGLANDALGYILPKSQWDALPPYTYGAAKAPYGEILSVGPETAGRIAQAYRELLEPAKETGVLPK